VKTLKDIRREKLINKPGKLGALWAGNFENLKRLKAAAKAQGMKPRVTPPAL
jgi:hypothetical protein